MNLESYQGLICYHAKTRGLMIIKNVKIYKEKLNFSCLVYVEDEKGKPYFADAVYSENEIILTDRNIKQIIEKKQQIEGKQLSLFN